MFFFLSLSRSLRPPPPLSSISVFLLGRLLNPHSFRFRLIENGGDGDGECKRIGRTCKKRPASV